MKYKQQILKLSLIAVFVTINAMDKSIAPAQICEENNQIIAPAQPCEVANNQAIADEQEANQDREDWPAWKYWVVGADHWSLHVPYEQ